jgi:hypothetical protein
MVNEAAQIQSGGTKFYFFAEEKWIEVNAYDHQGRDCMNCSESSHFSEPVSSEKMDK